MRFVLRAVLLVVGVGLCGIGISAGSKLFRDTLDSPRWMIGGLAFIYFIVGAAAIAVAIIDLRRQRTLAQSSTRDSRR